MPPNPPNPAQKVEDVFGASRVVRQFVAQQKRAKRLLKLSVIGGEEEKCTIFYYS